jgi:hypothetical protein
MPQCEGTREGKAGSLGPEVSVKERESRVENRVENWDFDLLYFYLFIFTCGEPGCERRVFERVGKRKMGWIGNWENLRSQEFGKKSVREYAKREIRKGGLDAKD